MPGPKVPEDQRREEVLAAAYRVATRDRLGGLTTRAVAKEAGVSNGLVFFHFVSREGLVLALLDRLLVAARPRRGVAVGQERAAGRSLSVTSNGLARRSRRQTSMPRWKFPTRLVPDGRRVGPVRAPARPDRPS